MFDPKLLELIDKHPASEGYLPVFVKISTGWTYLGDAKSHRDADVIGQFSRIAFNAISRACHETRPDKKFFVLH